MQIVPRSEGVSLRLALFTDTFTPQMNGVSRTLERLVSAVEARGGAVRVETVEDPAALPDARVVRWPSAPFGAYPQLRVPRSSMRRPRSASGSRDGRTRARWDCHS